MDPPASTKRKSRPRRSSETEELHSSNTSVRPSSSTAQAAASIEPSDDDRALYWQLLKHHHENCVDEFDGSETQSILSEEDKKLPAMSPHVLKALQHQYGIKREPLSSPFRQRNSDSIEPITVESKPFTNLSQKSPMRDFDHNDLLRERESKSNAREQSNSLSSTSSLPSEEIRSRSSFYKAALEAAGRTTPPPMNVQTFIEEDEKLARELAIAMEQEQPQVSAMDEELARALQETQDFTPPPNDEEKDVALALKLMQEEQEKAGSSYGIPEVPLTSEEQDVELALRLMEEEHQKQYRKPSNKNTDLDEEIAMQLSRSMLMGVNSDELLARQISKSNLTLPSHTNQLVPEQLLILERIRLEKENSLNQQIIMQSSLRGLPAFQDTAIGGNGTRSQSMNTTSDLQLSQELEFRDWNALPRGVQTRPTTIRPPTTRAPIRSFNAGDRGSSASDMWAQRNESRSNYNRNMGHSLNPGTAVAVNMNGREPGFEPRNIPLTQIRAVPNHPYQGGPSNSGFENARGVNSRGMEPPRAIDMNHHSRYDDPEFNHHSTYFNPPHNVTRRGSQESLASSISAWTNEQYRMDHIELPPSTNHQVMSSGLTNQSPSTTNHRVMSSGPTNELLRRGSQETRSAIATGQAHVVACKGCGNMLHAPISSSLVFCPTCKTISPGFSVRKEH
jgi:hypothetical protein